MLWCVTVGILVRYFAVRCDVCLCVCMCGVFVCGRWMRDNQTGMSLLGED